MGLHRIIACGLVMLFPTAAVQPQEVPTQAAQTGVLALESMDARQIDSLSRAETVFILPIGMIEEHGPHLPVGADTFTFTFHSHVGAIHFRPPTAARGSSVTTRVDQA